jgi:ribonuclease HI
MQPATNRRPRILAYTDGGCRGNPGPGAWAFLLVDLGSGAALERAGGEPHTTNNRMEYLAAISALESLKSPSEVEIRTDSRLLVNTVTQWMKSWKAKGWKKKGGPIKNLDLVQRLDALVQVHEVRWTWVKGHAGNPGNERVDELANLAMDSLQQGASPHLEQRHRECPVPIG